MLYTRCPKCETTFRITEGALQQAQGQVRCGRCSYIFDAHDSLTDRLQDPDDPSPDDSPNGPEATAATVARPAAPVADVPPPRDAAHAQGRSDLDAGSELIRIASIGAGGTATAEVTSIDPNRIAEASLAAEIETAAADAGDEDSESAQTGAAATVMSPDQIDAVLASPASSNLHWLDEDDDEDESEPDPRRKQMLLAAATVAALLLGIQFVDHMRSTLAGTPGIGAVVQGIYAAFGQRVTPDWDVSRYELLDWTAVEASDQQTQRNLLIRSQLRNSADRAQPYPLVHLQLLNRWEDAVAARLFEPHEYTRGGVDGDMMQAGETIAAELVIVDPGADAYGFELAVCIETATGVVCDNDATFR
jgi:predicted Zn finger-like uncharacterized protein